MSQALDLKVRCAYLPRDVLQVQDDGSTTLRLTVVLRAPDAEEPYTGHGIRLSRQDAARLRDALTTWLKEDA